MTLTHFKYEQKMKLTKIIPANAAAIDAALLSANGKSNTHAYTSYADISGIIKIAEDRLEILLGGKVNWEGAVVHACSGEALPKSYQYSRQCTDVNIVRKATGWFLESVACVLAFRDAGKSALHLTAAQDELAIKRLRKSYQVIKDNDGSA